jgi:hypothetical protein
MPSLKKVLLIKEGVYADLISLGAHASRIKYSYGGVLFDVIVENDEFEIVYDEEWKEDE